MRSFFVMLVALCLSMSPALSQNQIQKEAPPNSAQDSNGSLSQKLDRSNGVIRPRGDVDPGITKPAPVPNPGSTPVIPPPGSAGGNSGVQPK